MAKKHSQKTRSAKASNIGGKFTAQISAADRLLLDELKREVTAFENHQWRIGDILVKLHKSGWTTKAVAKEIGYSEAALSTFHLTSNIYGPDTRNEKFDWRRHYTSRAVAKTVGRERRTEPDYKKALAVIGAAPIQQVSKVSKATSYFRKVVPHNWNIPKLRKGEGMDLIICGDAIEETTKIADRVQSGKIKPIQLVMFSPPYHHKTLWEQYRTVKPYPTWNEWLEEQAKLAEQIFRIIPEGGAVAINTDDITVVPDEVNMYSPPMPRKPVQDEIKAIYRAKGLSWTDTFTWSKQNCVADHHMIGSSASPRINSALEQIQIFRKGVDNMRIDPDTFTVGDEFRKAWLTTGEWSFQPQMRSGQECPCPFPFPEEMPYRLISLFTGSGQGVLDPYSGSGTTCLVAKKLGRHFLGIELDETTAGWSQGRIDKAKEGDPVYRSVPTLKGLPMDPEMKMILAGELTRNKIIKPKERKPQTE